MHAQPACLKEMHCYMCLLVTDVVVLASIPLQSRAGQDGAPLSTESLMAERDRLVDSLAHVDVQIDGARKDLQRLARSDEQELCESRLIILQVNAVFMVVISWWWS